ncbi:hypothetical protein [Streptomyces sp. 5-6(2022)]|uniref:hypothetical protein n=1 Tax=Streptomyces sp. 5-6(2022) TaxID=2936510 RepID=UPI0023B9AB90|nr:hypothetical protein [Streptomyces sp. 5-6(2022)]
MNNSPARTVTVIVRAAVANCRVVNHALFKARGPGEQFPNYVLDGELWLEQDTQEEERPGSGRHVPGSGAAS